MTDFKILSDFKPLGAALNIKKPNPGSNEVKPFGELLKASVNEVNRLQLEADRSIEGLVSGQNKDIHGTMIAISKADLAFRMTISVRNKMIEAYQEIMRMPL
jgi:flagellar hook-basal body complex protein FliE